MHKRYASSLIITVVLFTANCFAQSNTISGNIKNTTGGYVPLAYVSLLKGADSALLQTGQTDDAGYFEYKDIAAGKYIIDIQALGYKNRKLPVDVKGNIKLGDIIITPKDNKLEEVVVTGRKDLVQTELGKTIINVSEQMKQGKTLLDILRNMPGVSVDGNGTISVNGKDGLMVLINDKPTYLAGRELAEYLQGVDASKVTKVELMTQPSAKYDAEGNTGIINIKMSKQHNDGWSGNLAARYNQAFYPFVGTNANLTYAKNKLAININPGFYRGVSSLENTVGRKSYNNNGLAASVEEVDFFKEIFYDYSLGLGADYDISAKTKTGISMRGIYHPNEERDVAKSILTDHTTGTVVYNNTTNDIGFVRNNINTNAYLIQTIDSNNEVQVNADYFKTNRLLWQDMKSYNYDAGGNQLPHALLLKNNIPDETDLYTLKADYTGKIGKGIKTEAGVKTSYATVDEKNKFIIYANNQWIPDTTRSNHFRYRENINSAYISCSGEKGSVKANAGVRVEHTHAEGDQVTQDKQFILDYTTVVPTAVVSCQADSNNTLELSYSKRMHRPFYRELNPFTWYTSQYSYKTGNPLLGPQYTNNFELKNNYKGRFIITASCSIVNGVYTDELFFEYTTKTTRYTVTNNGSKRLGALTAFFNGDVNDWLNIAGTGNVHYAEYYGRFNGKDVFATGRGCFLSIDTQFRSKKGWQAGIHLRHGSRQRVGILKEEGSNISMNGEVSKSFFKDTLNMRLSINDPFNLYRYTEFYDFDNIESTSSGNFNSRGARIALSYNFGQKERSARRNKIEQDSRI